MMALLMLLQTEVLAAKKEEYSQPVVVTRSYVNPLFTDKISEAELEKSLDRISWKRKATGKTCTNEVEAAKVMRDFLVKREAEFTIPVKLRLEKTTGTQDRNQEMEKIMKRICTLAFEETDKPYEGDYLDHIKGYTQRASGTVKNDCFEGTLEYYVPLMTSAAQEKEVDAAVARK